MGKPHLVITSIQPPNRVMRSYAAQCKANGFEFIVVGDTKSPTVFLIDDCRFIAVDDPATASFKFARACPVGHYARKNIGYLAAISAGADLIVETDDDNEPLPSFWAARSEHKTVHCLDGGGWINVYRYFSNATIWPRGLPLETIHRVPPALSSLPVRYATCPIQQGLVDGDPDVDAIYRLLMPLPHSFDRSPDVALGCDTWCPINSQNTAWWPAAFPLLYLPSYCSFRMTDIWRGFVAQRIACVNGWRILHHAPTMRQERNGHDLTRDFKQEVSGYLGNAEIAKLLGAVDVQPGIECIFDGLRGSYAALVRSGFVGREELPLLELWIDDCAIHLGASRRSRDSRCSTATLFDSTSR